MRDERLNLDWIEALYMTEPTIFPRELVEYMVVVRNGHFFSGCRSGIDI